MMNNKQYKRVKIASVEHPITVVHWQIVLTIQSIAAMNASS